MAESDKADQFFHFNTEDSVPAIIKIGVFKSFRHYMKHSTSTAEQVRHDIANSLRSLTDIVALTPGEDAKASKSKKTQEIKFYSAHHNALVEIFRDEAIDAFMTERFAINKYKGPKIPTTDERNENFKNDVAGWISHALSVVDNSVVKTVLNGIYTTLEKAEDTVGPFVEQFEKHVELFEQLAVIYEHAEEENLAKEKGCYNHAIAVEEGMKALGYA